MYLDELLSVKEWMQYQRERDSLYGEHKKMLYDILRYATKVIPGLPDDSLNAKVASMKTMTRHLLGNGYLEGGRRARNNAFWREQAVNIAFRMPRLPPRVKLSNNVFEGLRGDLERFVKKVLPYTGYAIVFHGYRGLPSDELQGYHFHVYYVPFDLQSYRRGFWKRRMSVIHEIDSMGGVREWLDSKRIDVRPYMAGLEDGWWEIMRRRFSLSETPTRKPLVSIREGAAPENPLERDVEAYINMFNYHHQAPPDRIRNRYKLSFDGDAGVVTYWTHEYARNNRTKRTMDAVEFADRCLVSDYKADAISKGLIRGMPVSRMVFDWLLTEKHLWKKKYSILDWATRPVSVLDVELARREEAGRLQEALAEARARMAVSPLKKCDRWLGLFKRTFALVRHYLEYRVEKVLNHPKRLFPYPRPKPPPHRLRYSLNRMKAAALKDKAFREAAPPEAQRLIREAESNPGGRKSAKVKLTARTRRNPEM